MGCVPNFLACIWIANGKLPELVIRQLGREGFTLPPAARQIRQQDNTTAGIYWTGSGQVSTIAAQQGFTQLVAMLTTASATSTATALIVATTAMAWKQLARHH